MNVKLIAHTALSDEFYDSFDIYDSAGGGIGNELDGMGVNDRAAVALTAIRTCYSANKPTEIVAKEGDKYFGSEAKDGEGGTDADRLIRQIIRSKHTSTIEHLTYTFAIEGLSRAALAQLTRHRVGFSFSVQSQRYVRFDSAKGGFDYATPAAIADNDAARREFELAMVEAQNTYDELRALGVKPEDARAILPQAATCNLVLTGNLRAILDFYGKRKAGRGAQREIADLAEAMREAVVKVDGWTARFFDEA